jgi:cytochrome c biogenesis protein CcdA
MHQVLFGAALLTSFLGGMVALLAPCCVSVMLPAYFATGFSRRSGIEVGPDGAIRWRADYGGAPKYTMFLPTTSLLADLKAGEHPS